MGIGSSLLLIAAGAVLRFAVNVNTNGIDLRTVGLILLIIGCAGLVISLFWMLVLTDRGPDADMRRRRETVIQEHEPRY